MQEDGIMRLPQPYKPAPGVCFPLASTALQLQRVILFSANQRHGTVRGEPSTASRQPFFGPG